MRRAAALLVALAVSGCGLFGVHKAVVPTPAHYTLGAAYQMGGVWYYPKDQTEYAATGLAAVTPDHDGATADGEAFDGDALAAAHHTLQLPSVARVTNLENGRQVLLRLDDRGPAMPGRLLGLTRHAAALLGARDGTQIRVELDGERTRALTEQVGGGPKLEVAAAPRAGVVAESLAPPPGIGQSRRGFGVAGPVAAAAAMVAPGVAAALPDQASEGTPAPGRIMLQASEFSRMEYARRVAGQLGGLHAEVERLQDGRSTRYRVSAGPFASVAAADAALDQARRAGVIDGQLVVE